jgi:phage recombination protein Bet
MSTELVHTEGAQLTPIEFTPERLQLLKDVICKGLSDDELRLFAEVCRVKGLDPFAKQIYAIKRFDRSLGRDVMTIQVGIDGFRLIADRTGKYEGQGPPMWCGEDGVWRDVWLFKAAPLAAKATIYRRGFREPMVKVALYAEYVQTKDGVTPIAMWSKMKANQLHKCAEALALRAAFPAELSGLHTNDEMAQADNDDAPEPPMIAPKAAPPPPLTTGLRRAEAPPAVKNTVDMPPPVPPDVARLWQGMTSVKSNVETLQLLRHDLGELAGQDAAERKYKEVLGRYGVEHSNQFKSFRDARHAARELYEAIKTLSEPPVIDVEPEPREAEAEVTS